MKKLFNTLLFIFALTGFTFAQDAQVAGSQGADALMKSKVSGEYSFVMPSNLTAENIAENSKYYTHYFTVEFDASTHVAKIHMVENTSKNRFVIPRFMSACGVTSIKVDDSTIDMSTFTEKYLQ